MKLVAYLLLLIALSIPLHELGHYLTAQALGADNIGFTFRGIDPAVRYTTSDLERAIAIHYSGGYLAGILYVTTWFAIRRRSSLFAVSLMTVGFLQLGIGTAEGGFNGAYQADALLPALIIMAYTSVGILLHLRISSLDRRSG